MKKTYLVAGGAFLMGTLMFSLMSSLILPTASPYRCSNCSITIDFNINAKNDTEIEPLFGEPSHSVPVWTYVDAYFSESVWSEYFWCLNFRVSCATRATWFSGCEHYYTPYWQYKLWYMNWDTGQWELMYQGWGESPNDWHLDWWPFNALTSYSDYKYIDWLQAGYWRLEIILSSVYGGWWDCYAVPHSDYFYLAL